MDDRQARNLSNTGSDLLALRLAATASYALAPLLAAQGRAVRERMPQLPGAAGPPTGRVAGAEPALRLVVIGESTVAGVGAPSHAEALTGQVAAALATHRGCAVIWRAEGQIGATARATRKRLVAALPPAPVDAVLVALGVNDTLRLHSPTRWEADLIGLVAALRERIGTAPIFFAAVPPMGSFPALPQPLRTVLGLRSRLLDASAAALAPRLASVAHLPLTLPVTPEQFCADGFHPGPAGYQAWGKLLAGGMVDLMSNATLP